MSDWLGSQWSYCLALITSSRSELCKEVKSVSQVRSAEYTLSFSSWCWAKPSILHLLFMLLRKFVKKEKKVCQLELILMLAWKLHNLNFRCFHQYMHTCTLKLTLFEHKFFVVPTICVHHVIHISRFVRTAVNFGKQTGPFQVYDLKFET